MYNQTNVENRFVRVYLFFSPYSLQYFAIIFCFLSIWLLVLIDFICVYKGKTILSDIEAPMTTVTATLRTIISVNNMAFVNIFFKLNLQYTANEQQQQQRQHKTIGGFFFRVVDELANDFVCWKLKRGSHIQIAHSLFQSNNFKMLPCTFAFSPGLNQSRQIINFSAALQSLSLSPSA